MAQDSDSAAAGVRVAEHSVAKKSRLAEELMTKERFRTDGERVRDLENLGKSLVKFRSDLGILLLENLLIYIPQEALEWQKRCEWAQ